ncbi:MAG: ABC transporter ATP-binding protein [Deltaproteobacteria bacterium]|nr:ABC transporter ATP-binding protein [Deltaproteobacteria bacterium]
MTPLLQITRLSKRFGGLPALSEVSFRAAKGQVTALIGPNGAGKTTLINCLTGVLRPDGGEIFFDGVNIAGLPAHRIARLGITRTFQNLRLFPRLSVLDNVLCGLTTEAGGSLFQALLRPPGLRHRERRLRLTAMEALDTFGLADQAVLPAAILPYGDKKRLEMARAFVSQPRLTLLDEPVAGLNPEETAQIAGLIRQMRLSGKTMVLVEHDMELVMGVSDHVVVLDGGNRIASGSPDEVRANPLVLEAYLGRMSATA